MRLSYAERDVFMRWGLLGSIAPDVDMLYFHLIDHRQHHHHTYVTHYPLVWIIALGISLLWFKSGQNRRGAIAALFFSANCLLHMLFDTIVGDIWWFAPFVDNPYSLFTVPALHTPWWLNFLLHWSFTVEIGILLWACYLWRTGTPSLRCLALKD